MIYIINFLYDFCLLVEATINVLTSFIEARHLYIWLLIIGIVVISYCMEFQEGKNQEKRDI